MSPTPHPLNTGFEWNDAVPPFSLVTPDQANQWNADGYFLLKNVLDLTLLDALTAAIDPMEEKTNSYLRTVKARRQFIARADEITFALHPVLRSEAAKKFARHPVFVALCADLMGPGCRLYWDQAVYKKAGCPEEFPWHQDNGYNFVLPQNYLTCWVPLTDATKENGCPWVMPGIHRGGTLEHTRTDLGWQCLEGLDGAVPVEARRGDVVVFSSLTPHRTGPNKTTEERKAYILQYCHDGSMMYPSHSQEGRTEEGHTKEDSPQKENAENGSFPKGIAQNDPDRQFLLTD